MALNMSSPGRCRAWVSEAERAIIYSSFQGREFTDSHSSRGSIFSFPVNNPEPQQEQSSQPYEENPPQHTECLAQEMFRPIQHPKSPYWAKIALAREVRLPSTARLPMVKC